MKSIKNIKINKRFLPAVFVVIILIAAGLGYRVYQYYQTRSYGEEVSIRTVSIIQAKVGGADNSLAFPGKLEAYLSAPIYSRVNGYLKKWYKDIGSKVKQSELLGEIESPEVDQQLQQAKSDLLAASSQEKLSKITYERWKNLAVVDAVSKQELDQKQTEYESKRALTQIAAANLQRAKTFAAYKNIPAPFSGIVIERNTDVGALVSSSGGKPLFVVANIDKLRLYVNIPQIFKNDIVVGLPASVTVPEFPGKAFDASVVRSSGAINESSNTSLVEIEIDNKDHFLTSGEYARVSMNLPSDHALLRVPSSAVIIKKEGVFLATVNQEQKVNFQEIKLGRDFGQEVEIVGSVDEKVNIINNPSDSLVAGEKVRFATPTPNKVK